MIWNRLILILEFSILIKWFNLACSNMMFNLFVLIADHKLKRGLSKTSENMMIVEQARSGVLKDIEEWSETKQSHSLDMLDYTFVLPDLSVYSEDFRAFLHKDLIETSTLVSLEQAGEWLISAEKTTVSWKWS